MQKIKYIVIHHSGGTLSNPLASSQDLTADSVNEYHRQKWNFKSNLNKYGGYNFFIEKDGKLTQFRAIGEETAAQYGHNKDSVSICLAGNFNKGSKDVPTDEQKVVLTKLIDMLLNPSKKEFIGLKFAPVFLDTVVIDVPDLNIVPHNFFSQTDCNGTSISGSWARNLYVEYRDFQKGDDTSKLYKLIMDLCYQIINLIQTKLSAKKTGGFERECDGFNH